MGSGASSPEHDGCRYHCDQWKEYCGSRWRGEVCEPNAIESGGLLIPGTGINHHINICIYFVVYFSIKKTKQLNLGGVKNEAASREYSETFCNTIR